MNGTKKEINMVKTVNYDINNLKTKEEEWLLHKKSKDWWYCTGYLEDQEGKKYSYQFTILQIPYGIVTPIMAMVAVTDFDSEIHYYRQRVNLSKKELTVTDNLVQHGDTAWCKKEKDGFHIKTQHTKFNLDVFCDYGKGAFWHCDNGRLQMGADGDKETTYYYSWTNMQTKGTLTLNGKTVAVTGKSWFDKQGGSYTLCKQSSWEWFSLRFYDDEEMMLFKFPTTGDHDGTYITKDSKRMRLNNYTITTSDFIECEGSKWSAGWELKLPGLKEEHYYIKPYMQGAINLAYFEELCGIYNDKGEEVGMCFTELLPHLYDNNKQDHSMLLKNIERG